MAAFGKLLTVPLSIYLGVRSYHATLQTTLRDARRKIDRIEKSVSVSRELPICFAKQKNNYLLAQFMLKWLNSNTSEVSKNAQNDTKLLDNHKRKRVRLV